jgi:uncharacterized protein (TIGR02246 family)
MMWKRSWLAALVAVAIAAMAMIAPGKTEAASASDTEAVSRAVDQWFVALNAMVAGDPEPFAAIFSHADDVLYMSGEGTFRVGWQATWADWQEQAKKSLGGHVEGDDIHIIVSGNLATVALIARATVKAPNGTTRELRVRQTHVFRKEDGTWKMIVHHADNIPVWDEIVGGK